MRRAIVTAVLAIVVASGIPATAHHSNPLYFDMSRAITLEGEVLRVQWINPHNLLFLQSKNDRGELDTWILHGASCCRRVTTEMRERLIPGTPISARVWPPRNPLYLNDAQTVLMTRPEDSRQSSRIVGAGQIRLANGDILDFGGGPKF